MLVSAILWMTDTAKSTAGPGWRLCLGLVAFFLPALSEEVSFMLPVVLLAWGAIEAWAIAEADPPSGSGRDTGLPVGRPFSPSSRSLG